MSIQAISKLTGWDRKTIRKYIQAAGLAPEYGPRSAPPSKLDAFKPYLEGRLRSGVWNARVLLRELRERNYTGSYTILTDWLRPQRSAARVVAVRRFETAPGQQAQVDWGHLGTLEMAGQEQKLHGFTFTLGYSRRMVAEAALDQKLGTLLRLHEAAFQQIGGVPEEILYDRMKTVWLGTDERGEIVWHPVFLDFARYWGFTPRLCRPYRAQTKGKVESGVKYVRRNFLCGLQGREPDSLSDLNAQLREWIWGVANQRVHGTTHEQVLVRWDVEQFSLQSLAGQPPYPHVDGELRKVARDAYVDWQGSRYSVPWQYAGQDVWVREMMEQASKKEPSYADFLDELLNCEVEARRTRYLRARLQLAHFPFVKTFEQFDFGFQPSLDDRQIRELRSLRFIHEASNVIFLGPPGVGKTHLSVALAEEAIRSGLGAYFITAHDLAADLGRAYREGRLDRRMRVYLAPKVLVIDEVGYLPLDDLGATIFFQLVSARYERGSIILTSNKSYGDWGSIFGDSIIATAILDRLLHHSTTINIRGESYRLKDRRKAGLVPPRGQEGAEAAARSLASDSVPPKARQKTALGSTPSEAKEAHS